MSQKMFSYLTPTQEGLALGDTLIAKRQHDGTLAIAGHEDEMLALLSIGYRRPIAPEILGQIRAISKAYSQTSPSNWPSLHNPDYYPPHAPDTNAHMPSAKTKTLMHLALTGLNKAENIHEIAPYLVQAKKMLAAGIKPLAFLKAVGLAPDSAEAWQNAIRKFNPNHDPSNGEFTGPGGGSDNSNGLDINIAVTHLNANAQDSAQGNCAHYVVQALAAGGVNVAPPDDGGHGYAKDFGPSLEDVGFASAADADNGEGYPPANYTPQAGDVVVMQPHPGGGEAGHMAMYNGEQWVSDYMQNTRPQDPQAFWPGAGYRSYKPAYVIYRYKS